MERSKEAVVADELSETQAADRANVWHPYTQAATAPVPKSVVRGTGAKLFTEDGKVFIDAISSWWVTLFGHGHPYIAERIAEQAKTMEHVIFADFTHQPAAQLAKELVSLLSPKMSRVFYSDNGSTAVETALKIAFQYWHLKAPEQKRDKIVVFKGGFHGETIGSMALSDHGLFSEPFQSLMFDVIAIDPPTKGHEAEALEQLRTVLENESVACFFFEPLVQGVSGMRFHEAEGLDAMLELCHEHQVLSIADEVMVGCGRLGPLFPSQELNNPPDMLCLAKPLTGGFVPLGATVCTEEIYTAFLSDDRRKAFLHGHSYCANPIGCAAALATLELLQSEACVRQRQSIEQQHLSFQQQISKHRAVANCRVMGTLLALDYRSDEDSYFSGIRDQLAQHFRDAGILIRPFGNSIHVLPPYCISEAELEEVYRSIEKSLELFE